MTNTKKILTLLSSGEWECTSPMYAMNIADPRTILAGYKKINLVHEPRWCENEMHIHKGRMKEWKLRSHGLKLIQKIYGSQNKKVKIPA